MFFVWRRRTVREGRLRPSVANGSRMCRLVHIPIVLQGRGGH